MEIFQWEQICLMRKGGGTDGPKDMTNLIDALRNFAIDHQNGYVLFFEKFNIIK